MTGCTDDEEPTDDGQVTAASANNETGSDNGTTGGVATTLNDSLTDAGGADYGGPEGEDTFFNEEGEEAEASADTTDDGGDGPTGSDTGATAGSDTGGTAGSSGGATGTTSVGEMNTTDGGGADYGGAPPPDQPI